jgi:diadenosine tetraphosphate (Ap4A) HIT family hydrolase
MNDCFFCKLWHVKSRMLWENSSLYLVFDNFPVSPGHALLIPKRHVKDFAEVNATEWNELKPAIQEAITVIGTTDLVPIYQQFVKDHISDQSVWFSKKALAHPRINTKPDAYNHGFNDGKAAGRTIDHLHWHIIPRYEGDMNDPRGGVRFVIPEMGNYKISRS